MRDAFDYLKWPPLALWPYSAELFFLYFAFVVPCGALQTHFHERGCSGKRHLLSLAPCGSIASAERTGSTPGRTPSQVLCNASCSPSGTSCHLPRPGESVPKGAFALSVKPFGFASSPEGRAKTVEEMFLDTLLKGCQGRNGSASCLSL